MHHTIYFFTKRRLNLKFISQLKSRLTSPLPGWSAQSKMSPIKSRDYKKVPDTAKRAGVMALMYPAQNAALKMIYIKRPSKNPLDKHGGQVSFPGGQYELGDENIIRTALRETEEEIGIPSQNIQVLGQLSPIYVFVSNFLVRPTVGYIDYQPEFILQDSEVDYIITTSISHLLDPTSRKRKDLKIRNNTIRQVPYFDIRGEVLWGATAMMTSELLEIIAEL